MTSPYPLAAFLGIDWLYWWQIPLLLLVVALLVFLRIYKRRQM